MIDKMRYLLDNKEAIQNHLDALTLKPYRNINGFIDMERNREITRFKRKQKMNLRAIDYELNIKRLNDRISTKEER